LVGLLEWGIGPSEGLYQQRAAQHRKSHTSMPRAEFEPTAPVFERYKTIRALDRAITGAGVSLLCPCCSEIVQLL